MQSRVKPECRSNSLIQDERWVDLSDRAREAYRSLADSLTATNGRLVSQAVDGGNEALPFWCSLSLNQSGPQGVEDFVIELVIARIDGYLKATSDLSTGEGIIVLEGRSEVVLEADADNEWISKLGDEHVAFVKSTETYLKRNLA